TEARNVDRAPRVILPGDRSIERRALIGVEVVPSGHPPPLSSYTEREHPLDGPESPADGLRGGCGTTTLGPFCSSFSQMKGVMVTGARWPEPGLPDVTITPPPPPGVTSCPPLSPLRDRPHPAGPPDARRTGTSPRAGLPCPYTSDRSGSRTRRRRHGTGLQGRRAQVAIRRPTARGGLCCVHGRSRERLS